MGREQERRHIWTGVRGRNGYDPPMSLPDDICVDMLNVEMTRGDLGTKRRGSTPISLTFDSGGPFSGAMRALLRHVPREDETEAEFWAVDEHFTVGRLLGSAGWVEPTFDDPITNFAASVMGASYNGKFFLAYKSAVDRLHVWDPDTNTVRRTGVAAPAAAIAANDGSGSYTATVRYYRVRYAVYDGSIVLRRSEPSPVTTFTPDGSSSGVVITKPAAINEYETHWEIEVSPDNALWFRLPAIVVGTGSYTDTTEPWLYDGDTPEEIGTFTLQKSYRYILADRNRLVGFCHWESTATWNRVEFSPVLGALDISDDERILDTTLVKGWIDFEDSDSGGPRGLAGPVDGFIYACKRRQIIRLVQTGLDRTPYRPIIVSKVTGSLSFRSLVVGEDQAGAPALYGVGARGPWRLGRNGLEDMTSDIQDIWDTVMLDSTDTNERISVLTVYHSDKRQVWIWLTTTLDALQPNVLLIFDVNKGVSTPNGVQGGWTQFTGTIASVYSSCMFSRDIGSPMGERLTPHVGVTTGTTVLAADAVGTSTDNGTPYQALLVSKPYPVGPPGQLGSVSDALLLAESAAGVPISLTLIKNLEADRRTFRTELTPDGIENRVLKRLSDASTAEAWCVQYQLGDPVAIGNQWTLDSLTVSVEARDPL